LISIAPTFRSGIKNNASGFSRNLADRSFGLKPLLGDSDYPRAEARGNESKRYILYLGMSKATINGIELNYQVKGNGTPIILVHGHPFDHTMWQPQIEVFSKHYQVITPDLRGYGKSSLPDPENTKFADYATDVLRLADHLGADSFHLAGLSMGGQLIMEIYRQAPARVKSLILADTFAGLDTPDAKKARDEGAAKLEKEGMNGYADESIYKMIKSDHVASMPAVAGHVLKMMKATSPVSAATAMRARSGRIDYLNEVLPKIHIPTLIIVGRQDEFTPVAKAEEMQHALQNCALVIIENAGHMPNLEQPEAFNKIVLDFLKKH
jgi:3-oxoadipate enol-lactonase